METRIHKYKQGEKYIVLDVNSGGVHLVDEMIYQMLDHICPEPNTDTLGITAEELAAKLPQYDKSDIAECLEELEQLYKDKCLFSEDEYRQFADKTLNSPIKAMCLHVSHDCNLRCEYCFAETGDFGTGRKLMPVEVGKKAIDFLIEKSFGRENLEVDFFGGEPLMAWDTVTATVDYARSIEKQHGKNFRFTITTNGMLLDDEKIEYINREMSNCVLSLDGRKEVNDRIRFTPNHKGSYDIIVPKFKKLVEGRTKEGRTDYYIRGTFTKYNLDFANDILHFAELGFKQLSVEPVVTDSKFPYALTEEDLPVIYKEYDRLYEIMEKDPGKFNFFHFKIDLNQGPCAIKRLRGCGCGNEYIAVTPDGEIFPCHQFVGIDEWKMGNIFEGNVDKKIKDYFAKTHIYSKKGCSDCWARFYCSGGCNANSFQYEGDVQIPNSLACKLQQKRIECGIALGCE
ncbi:MAG: thioether cross-link-forming SCIFF peptide maturase [Ruminococcaceae bacterium]|nr:thioether cross-link-forming SCIFF peptide maturase [Oscillospiraceae bacterium]